MRMLTVAGDAIGAILLSLAVPVAILAIGVPIAMAISLVLGLAGLL